MGYSLDEETNEEEDLEKLDGEDVGTPLSPPDGVITTVTKDDPSGDTGADIQEWQDAGRDAAFNKEDPGNRGIEGFHKGPDEHNGPVKIKKPKQP